MDWIAKYWVEVLFGIVLSILTAMYKALSMRVKKYMREDQAEKEALLSLLDDRMGQLYRDCKQKGYVTKEELRRYDRMYKAYHDGLHGNGAVTIEYEKFCKMELRDD